MSSLSGLRDFQRRVRDWVLHVFGPEIAADKVERNDRFIEEALELVQSLDCPKERVLMLVDYVYSRPLGDPPQEVGGVMVTMAALCEANKISLGLSAVHELVRVSDPEMSEKIRLKQESKPRGSPLPIPKANASELTTANAKLAEKDVRIAELVAQLDEIAITAQHSSQCQPEQGTASDTGE